MEEKWKHVCAEVEKYGKDRKKKMPQEWCPASFLAGAMAVYFALGEENHLPSHWVMSFVMGKGLAWIFEEQNNVETKPYYPDGAGDR